MHLADLVEKHRALVGELELSWLVLNRAGERAALEPEQLRLEQLGRQSCAVDFDERTVAPRGRGVNGAGDEFLSRAALAADEHGHVGVGNARRSDRVPPASSRSSRAVRRRRAERRPRRSGAAASLCTVTTSGSLIEGILPFALVRSRRSLAPVEQAECHGRKSFAFLGKRSAFRRLWSCSQACLPTVYGSWLLRVGS